MKIIRKPYSRKPDVRFDEEELEIEPSATTAVLHPTATPNIKSSLQGKHHHIVLLALLITGLRRTEPCSLKVDDLKTYRNQPVIDVISKGRKFPRTPLSSGTLLAIKDDHKAAENKTDPAHPVFQTLGKHGPYQERLLTQKAVDCLVKSVLKTALIQNRIHPHVMRHTFATPIPANLNEKGCLNYLSREVDHD